MNTHIQNVLSYWTLCSLLTLFSTEYLWPFGGNFNNLTHTCAHTCSHANAENFNLSIQKCGGGEDGSH